ncbi:SMP-30/gluconolactonase/LRE family protein [Nocardia sp. NBC_01009]|uniref:SMP-30/gluconolactonase/LRE family protein n=1 Tax=Nocardia sp. NBC_01009 TaxID=2975996 RepID=UPI003867821E|nr:SMP-30/gluconolactonase/LRE family protein [Nocardia sp. NBC_01009]
MEILTSVLAELGEGPTWDSATRRLLWMDILDCRVHCLDPESGAVESITVPQHVGAAKPRSGGGLVLNLRDGIGLRGPDGSFDWLFHDPVAGRRGNDAAVAPDGALWAGTMRYDETRGGGTLARIAPSGTAETVLGNVAVSNGIGWSPDGRRMYYIDSSTGRIDTFDFIDGHAHNRKPWVTIESGAGWPDGLTVDAAGAIWVALWDGGAVRRYTPHGRLDRVVELPVPRTTACAFGGAELTDLYVTTARIGSSPDNSAAGRLFVLPGVGQGLTQPAFQG